MYELLRYSVANVMQQLLYGRAQTFTEANSLRTKFYSVNLTDHSQIVQQKQDNNEERFQICRFNGTPDDEWVAVKFLSDSQIGLVFSSIENANKSWGKLLLIKCNLSFLRASFHPLVF